MKLSRPSESNKSEVGGVHFCPSCENSEQRHRQGGLEEHGTDHLRYAHSWQLPWRSPSDNGPIAGVHEPLDDASD